MALMSITITWDDSPTTKPQVERSPRARGTTTLPVVTRSARKATRICATDLGIGKAIAHRADRRASKAALQSGTYERYEANFTPLLTSWEVA
jgi:hypothetical protein